MKHMYGGELIVTLNPTIKPWDKVYLFDEVTQMSGICGVRQVHHHFDAETGAWTAITPDLMTHERNFLHVYQDKYEVEALGSIAKAFLSPEYREKQKISAADMMKSIRGNDSDLVNWRFPVLSGLFGATVSGLLGTALSLNPIGGLIGGAVGGLYGSYKGYDYANQIWRAGVGRLFHQQGIQLVGLWYAGTPFYAGITGFRRENLIVHYNDLMFPLVDFFKFDANTSRLLYPTLE
jgi:hypothetical protein